MAHGAARFVIGPFGLNVVQQNQIVKSQEKKKLVKDSLTDTECVLFSERHQCKDT